MQVKYTGSILIVSLLIPVMNTSYSELWANAQKESKYSKSYFQVKDKQVSA